MNSAASKEIGRPRRAFQGSVPSRSCIVCLLALGGCSGPSAKPAPDDPEPPVAVAEEPPLEPCGTCCPFPPAPAPTTPAVAATWDPRSGIVELRFSDAVRVPEDFDPNDFRLSVADSFARSPVAAALAAHDSTEGLAMREYEVNYYDPIEFFSDEMEPEGTTRFIKHRPRGDSIRLTARPRLAVDCTEVEAFLKASDRGVFVHYRPGEAGAVEIEGAGPLGAAGADWAGSPAVTDLSASGSVPVERYAGLIPVRCGKGLPPRPESAPAPPVSPPPNDASDPTRCACCDGPTSDDDPPSLIRAERITGRSIRLRFDEPVADGFFLEPTQFRLSVLEHEVYDGRSEFTLSDPCRRVACKGDGMRVVDIVREDGGPTTTSDTDILRLELSEPLAADLFDPPESGERQVLLHYSRVGPGQITDVSGNALSAFGAAWALSPGRFSESWVAQASPGVPQPRPPSMIELVVVEAGPLP